MRRNLATWQQDSLRLAIDAAREAESVVAQFYPYPRALGPVTVAQFILESDWGRRSIGPANNFFGIKARDDEPFVSRPTREFIGGRMTTVVQKFKRYDNMAACFIDHARLICERKWKGKQEKIYAKALSVPDDPIAFAHALTGVYATDPEYGNKLEAVMRENDLLAEFGFNGDNGGADV